MHSLLELSPHIFTITMMMTRVFSLVVNKPENQIAKLVEKS